jgi:hypothetical protein
MAAIPMRLLTELEIQIGWFYKYFAPDGAGKICVCRSANKSGGGPPHSKTLARGSEFSDNAERPGLRQPSGAFTAYRRMNLQKSRSAAVSLTGCSA